MAIFALLGLVGYAQSTGINWSNLNMHTVHAWLGSVALVLSLLTFAYFNVFELQKKKEYVKHRRAFVNIGKAAAVFAAISLLGGVALFAGVSFPTTQAQTIAPTQVSSSNVLPEVEATEFQGVELVSIAEQRNNAIFGTQYLDREAYRLDVVGLVDQKASLSYDELLALPAYSEAVYMPCVEGWGFMAKWTGFRVDDVLNKAGVQPEGTYVMFHSADGYSTGLPLSYIRENNLILAYGLNDVTLPADRGWPLQLVAKSKYGYKWGKWITRIEVLDEEARGFWESRGYSNDATVGGPAFGP
jgi:DMSO/TMAO reductase YedYZ molybdopterin-dependent catalytic subunit